MHIKKIEWIYMQSKFEVAAEKVWEMEQNSLGISHMLCFSVPLIILAWGQVVYHGSSISSGLLCWFQPSQPTSTWQSSHEQKSWASSHCQYLRNSHCWRVGKVKGKKIAIFLKPCSPNETHLLAEKKESAQQCTLLQMVWEHIKQNTCECRTGMILVF